MKVSIKRAPALTPWAAVVAEQLGFDSDEALSLGNPILLLTLLYSDIPFLLVRLDVIHDEDIWEHGIF